MRKIIPFFILSIVLTVSNSCKNDLDSLAPYVESVAVYGLLDQNDSVNYIRVNRVFLGQGDATQIAQIQDSAYFKPDEASVVVEKYWNGIKKQTYIFSETYEVPLQPGAFNTNQLIYKSTTKFRSDSAGKYFEYKLLVRINKSGKEFTATTKLIKDLAPGNTSTLCSAVLGQNCFFSQNSISIRATSTKVNVKFLAQANSGICGVKTRFYYHAIYNDNTSTGRYMEYDLGNQKTDSYSGGQVMDFSFKGETFYNILAAKVVGENNLKERVADSMSFIFSFAGSEYSLYREINNTTGSFGQDKPIYTNISNGGVGVFSSRTTITIVKRMFDCTGGSNQPNTLFNENTINYLNEGACQLLFRGPNCPQNTGC